jgi:hypothetical protein
MSGGIRGLLGQALAFALLVGCTADAATRDEGRATGPFGPPGTVPGLGGSGAANAGLAGGSAPGTAPAGMTASSGASTSLNLTGAPQYTRFVRLTNAQWARSVQDILKLSAPPGLEGNFQSPVAGTTDFTNNELVLSVDQRAASDFQSAAETLASMVTASSATLSRVYPGTDAAGFIATLGRRAYRRPLTSAESASYMALFDKAATLSGTQSPFVKGAGLVIRAMLQSPHFLYRTELSDPGTPLSGYELAAKLSLWLRETTPSDELLDSAAGPGRLDTPEGAAMLANTMLQEPTAVSVMRDFHNELYHFDRYGTISKIGVRDYDPSLNAEYLETSYRFFDKLFTAGLGVKELLTSTTGFVGPRTAALYGLSVPASGYVEAELGPTRVGYFSQIPFLSLNGLNADPDSIHRGVSMNLDVLCTVLGPPAAMLPPIPALEPGQTNRQRISKLTEGCGGVCHNQQINPLGFAFEHFDGMGRYRDTENGNLPIVSSGTFMFSEGSQMFAGAAELMRSMAAGKQAHTCYAKKLASFGLQRDIVDKDVPLLEALSKASMQNGSIKNIILALVRNDAFRVRSGAGL